MISIFFSNGLLSLGTEIHILNLAGIYYISVVMKKPVIAFTFGEGMFLLGTCNIGIPAVSERVLVKAPRYIVAKAKGECS